MESVQLIMAHIDLPVKIIDNMIEPMQEYLHISFTQCDSLPERTDCGLQTALSDKIQEYLHEQNQFDESSPIQQEDQSEEIVQNIHANSEQESTIFQEDQIDNTSQYITLEELSNKKKAIHHKHSTFKKHPKNMHNVTSKMRFNS